MSKKEAEVVEMQLDKIVGGGQAFGALPSGKKLFAWGGLPGESVSVRLTKKKSGYAEGIVVDVLRPSGERVSPRDPESFLSTSPWQIMSFDAEQRHKAELIKEAFELHHVSLPHKIHVYTNDQQFEYRNKVEFSFWWDTEFGQLNLAFFRRGTHSKVPVQGTSLAMPAINQAAERLLAILRERNEEAFALKTVIIRADQNDNVVLQLYAKTADIQPFSTAELAMLDAEGFELIYSDPKSPASVITKRLQQHGRSMLVDTILGTPFSYAAESFFQVNIPVYEQALRDMQKWVSNGSSVPGAAVDLYSGVGSIGLTIGGPGVTLVEINELAVREMKRNIEALGIEATPVLAASEQALEYIIGGRIIIVDPPRAGLHADVINKLIEVKPPRIIYLSCNPVTQARDVQLLAEEYDIAGHTGYNFFPRTPHIEHLVILDAK